MVLFSLHFFPQPGQSSSSHLDGPLDHRRPESGLGEETSAKMKGDHDLPGGLDIAELSPHNWTDLFVYYVSFGLWTVMVLWLPALMIVMFGGFWEKASGDVNAHV